MPWEVLPFLSPVLPIHAALLPPDGQGVSRVFFFAGSSNNFDNSITQFRVLEGGALWTYPGDNFERPATPTGPPTEDYPDGAPLDLFCGGQSLLPDGRLLVAGGTAQYDPFWGAAHAFILDSNINPKGWIPATDMGNGRWYPTQVTLGDGKILAVSGTDQNEELNQIPEIYDPTNDTWQSRPDSLSPYPLYAHLFLLLNGRIFYSGGYFGQNYGVTPRILNLLDNTELPIGGLRDEDSRDQSVTVLLPPAQNQQFLVIGGGISDGPATNLVDQVSPLSSTRRYAARQNLIHARKHHHAVLLPDRTVFVCGGSGNHEGGAALEEPPVEPEGLPAEIYNPATNTWTEVEAEGIPRLYHSVALLLPDGSVLSAGGNPRRLNECPDGFNNGFACEELRLGIYKPSYMSAARPVINSISTTTLPYGGILTIATPQARSILWVNLIRPMATTHSCDVEQRVVNVAITARTNTTLTAQLNTTGNVAPPGWYMLFITNNSTPRIPSEARWVKVG
jgi:hypothetical protein